MVVVKQRGSQAQAALQVGVANEYKFAVGHEKIIILHNFLNTVVTQMLLVY